MQKIKNIIKKLINIFLEIKFFKKLIESYRPNFLILYYHRIINDNDFSLQKGPNIHLCVKESEFKKQMQYIKENFKLVSLDNLYDSNFKCDEFSVAVTFDDGYLDNFNIAYPILKELKIPATIFLISRNIIATPWAWWIELWNYVQKNNIINYEDKEYLIEDFTQKEKFFFKIKNILKKLNFNEQKNFFEKLTDNDRRENHQSIFMQKEEIEKMYKSELITFGCHTHSHICFSNFSTSVIEEEIKKSKSILESKLNLNIFHFAYPYGSTKDINFIEHKILKKLEFKSALTTSEIIKNDSYQFYLPRVSIGPYVTINDFRRKLTGFDIMLKKIIN